MHIPTDSLFLPVAVPVVLVAIAALVFLVVKRSRTSRVTHGEMYSQFIPPIIGQNIPKEQTYIVPRNWKPPSGSVYSQLSVPIHKTNNSSLFTLPNIRPKEIVSMVALKPAHTAGISPEFV